MLKEAWAHDKRACAVGRETLASKCTSCRERREHAAADVYEERTATPLTAATAVPIGLPKSELFDPEARGAAVTVHQLAQPPHLSA